MTAKDNRAIERRFMVARQIAGRDVTAPLVIAAMEKVPRHRFVPDRLQDWAYDDGPLPIGEGQTISQPYIVAYMTEALQLAGGEKVLEIGAGSGYAAAVLAEIAGEVFTIERHEKLAERAERLLEDLGYENVRVRSGDGTLGWPEEAPFDAIVVTAAGPEVPQSLKRQLKDGGRLVMPVEASRWGQSLFRVTRLGPDDYKTKQLCDVRFVPLIGAEAWKSEKQMRGIFGW